MPFKARLDALYWDGDDIEDEDKSVGGVVTLEGYRLSTSCSWDQQGVFDALDSVASATADFLSVLCADGEPEAIISPAPESRRSKQACGLRRFAVHEDLGGPIYPRPGAAKKVTSRLAEANTLQAAGVDLPSNLWSASVRWQ